MPRSFRAAPYGLETRFAGKADVCLILFAHALHPHFPLLLSANRDEFHDRPTAPLAEWPDAPGVFGGRDLRGGGTWFGVDRRGRWAAVTNFRDPADLTVTTAPSRGLLVSEYLTGESPPADFARNLAPVASDFSGFNLLLGAPDEVWWLSNRASPERWGPLDPGLYGVSNHLLDTPWPKVVRGKRALSEIVAAPSPSPDDLLRPLLDQALAADHDLPTTGVPRDLERALSAAFINTPGYGTRSSTALLLHRDGVMTLAERRFGEGGAITGEDTLTIDLVR